MTSRAILYAAVVGLLASCADPATQAPLTNDVANNSDIAPGGLLSAFMQDGKYDDAGHPIGATVWQVEDDCSPHTGHAVHNAWQVNPSDADAGPICRTAPQMLGRGVYVANVRALSSQVPTNCRPFNGQKGKCTIIKEDALTLSIRDRSGALIAEKVFPATLFWRPMQYENLALEFEHTSVDEVVISLNWPGQWPVRVDYIELFRADQRLTLTPPSGLQPATQHLIAQVYGDADTQQVDINQLTASCNGIDKTDALHQALLAQGIVAETTQFRTIWSLPLAPIIDGCHAPARISISTQDERGRLLTARTTYWDQPIACTFAPNRRRVLITGFEPFPAAAITNDRHNSSQAAVEAFSQFMMRQSLVQTGRQSMDEDQVAAQQFSVMHVVLPVEWDSAANWLAKTIDACEPDMVISFGQGRTGYVDIETTGYNVKDGRAAVTGTPDNRGIIYGGEPVAPNGPDVVTSTLPTDAIVSALNDQANNETGVWPARLSDNPGRYVCNNVFFATALHLTTSNPAKKIPYGFVHLPNLPIVSQTDKEGLAQVVATIVRQSLK